MIPDTERQPGRGQRTCSSRRCIRASFRRNNQEELFMKRDLLITLAIAGVFALATQLYAHHSFAPPFHEAKQVEFEGKLFHSQFRNHHPSIRGLAQKATRWSLEWAVADKLDAR